MQKQTDFGKWASVVICAGAVWLFLRYAAASVFAALLPFLIAAALTLLVSPLAEKTSRWLHIGKSVCSAILFFLCIALTLTLGGFVAARLLREAQGLVARLLADVGSPSSVISDAIDALRLPETEESEAFRAHLKTMLTDLAGNLLGTIASRLPRWAAKLASGVPAGVLFAVVTVLSGLRFCTDGVRLKRASLALLPKRWRKAIVSRSEDFLRFCHGFLRAYLLLFLLTFFELLVGFLVLGLDYAVLPALLVAAVDILPVLGVGTVLLPWAIVELLCRRFYLGFGLILLWLVVTVVRQVIEPRLLGKTLGVDPLLSLAASYIGWRLFGVAGLLLGPLAAVALRFASARK